MAVVIDGNGNIDGLLVGAGLDADALSGRVPASNAPSNSIVQVLQTTTTTQTATTSATYVDVAGMTLTITPSSATSRVWVLLDIAYYIQADNANRAGFQLMRGSTIIYTDDGFLNDGVNANVALAGHAILSFVDSPATTSPVTYKLQIRRSATAGTSYNVQVNGLATNRSSFTLMEVTP